MGPRDGPTRLRPFLEASLISVCLRKLVYEGRHLNVTASDNRLFSKSVSVN